MLEFYSYLCAQVLLAVYLLYNCSVFWWPWFDQSWYFTIHRHQTCTIICIRSYALYASISSVFLWLWLSAEWSIAFKGAGWDRDVCAVPLGTTSPLRWRNSGHFVRHESQAVLAFWLTMSDVLQSPQLLHDFCRVKVKSKLPHLTALVQSWIWCSGVLRICRAGSLLAQGAPEDCWSWWEIASGLERDGRHGR